MHPKGFIKICNDAKSKIREVSPQELNDKITSGEYLVLIDVREDSEVTFGCLPEAIHLSKGVVERDIENTILEKDVTIIVYCSGGYRSALVADNLQQMGYLDVMSLSGGSKAWVAEGYPLHTN